MIIVGKSSSQNCQQYQNKNKNLKLLSEKCISIEFDMYVVCIYIFSDNFFFYYYFRSTFECVGFCLESDFISFLLKQANLICSNSNE